MISLILLSMSFSVWAAENKQSPKEDRSPAQMKQLPKMVTVIGNIRSGQVIRIDDPENPHLVCYAIATEPAINAAGGTGSGASITCMQKP